jgi:hypothetical protein
VVTQCSRGAYRPMTAPGEIVYSYLPMYNTVQYSYDNVSVKFIIAVN